MQMARNGNDLEAVSWLGIVALDVLHVFQGPELCQNVFPLRNRQLPKNLLSNIKFGSSIFDFVYWEIFSKIVFFCSKCINMFL